MGCTSSRSDIPRPPYNVQNDPHLHDSLVVHIAQIQDHEDFGVWRNLLPPTYEQQAESIWLWFNRVVHEEVPQVQIDLENFKRGTIEDMPEKGRVLYNILLPNPFVYESFQRYVKYVDHHPHHASSYCLGEGDRLEGKEGEIRGFEGLLREIGEDGKERAFCVEEEDDYYTSHPLHRNKITSHITGKLLPQCLLTKWRCKQRIVLEDGTEGRNIHIFGEELHPILEIQVRGTVVTSYVEEPSIVKEIEHTIKKRESFYAMLESDPKFCNTIEKLQTEFIDFIECRLLMPQNEDQKEGNNEVIAQWAIRGDSFHHSESRELHIQTPLFNITLPRGWSELYDFQVQIPSHAMLDSAMLMMIAYLHGTEFSVKELKKKIRIHTPDKPTDDIEQLVEDPKEYQDLHNFSLDEIIGETHVAPNYENPNGDEYMIKESSSTEQVECDDKKSETQLNRELEYDDEIKLEQ